MNMTNRVPNWIMNIISSKIRIKPSPTADTRTCDVTKVDKTQLLDSSNLHIADVKAGLSYFQSLLQKAGNAHDHTKLSGIDQFHKDFKTSFKEHSWWDNHRKEERHHLSEKDGIRDDVNLIDVIEYLTDCVMAGMARSGKVDEIKIDNKILQDAFKNTIELLKSNVELDK